MKLSDIQNLKENFYVHYAALIGAVFLIAGKPVPYANETSYLLRLVKTYRPDFLLNDFTFATPANEHWLFNHLFGALTFVFSPDMIGWFGRISCWMILIYALIRLGRHWKIPLWAISVSIFLWLFQGQSIVADEWIIGGFEAKCVAYICLIFALDGFCKGREIVPSILLGLTFSFHPAVGLWSIPAAILSLAVFRWDFFRVLKITAISGIFSLFGLIPLLFSEVAANINTPEDWKFYVLVGYPFHVDPATWAKSSIILLFCLMAFCFLSYWRNRANESEKAQQFFIAFLSVLFLFFCAGILLRMFDQFELLRLMPTRLFPVFAPLFFLFALAKAYEQKVFARPVNSLMIVGLICLLGWMNPVATGFQRIEATVQKWRIGTDDMARSFDWIKENTPNGTIVIAPPWRNDFWFFSERAQVISRTYAPVSNLHEWQTRLELLSGESPLEQGWRNPEDVKESYEKLTSENVLNISKNYRANYFVSETEYPLPVVFMSGKSKVYKLADLE